MKTVLFVVLALMLASSAFAQGTRSDTYAITIADTANYASGEKIGSRFTIIDGAQDSSYQCFIMGVMVYDAAKSATNMTLVIYDSAMAQGTDSTTFAPGDSTFSCIVAIIPITTWKSFSLNAIGYATDIREMVPRKPRLYGQLISDATAVFMPGDLRVRINRMWTKP